MDKSKLAEALIDALENTPLHVTVGTIDDVPVITQRTMEGMYFFFDLNNFDFAELPTKEQAMELLNKLNAYYQSFLDASPAFTQYMSDKQFSAQLGVYVERLCFPICTLVNGQFKWEKN